MYISVVAGTSVTFRWQATNDAPGGGQVNFAVTLFANGTFRIDYGAGNANLNPIVGVSAGNDNAFVLSKYNGSSALGSVEFHDLGGDPGADLFRHRRL